MRKRNSFRSEANWDCLASALHKCRREETFHKIKQYCCSFHRQARVFYPPAQLRVDPNSPIPYTCTSLSSDEYQTDGGQADNTDGKVSLRLRSENS